jgi:hypothetical protein
VEKVVRVLEREAQNVIVKYFETTSRASRSLPSVVWLDEAV